MNFKEWQKNQKVILIDGSMSLGLEEQGLDLNDELWTAKALVNEPDKIEKSIRTITMPGQTSPSQRAIKRRLPGSSVWAIQPKKAGL